MVLITQILLEQSLGVNGRGTVAAATAPLMLAAVFLTLGLPEALTFFVARGVVRLPTKLIVSLLALGLAGCVGTLTIFLLASPLSVGSGELSDLIRIASLALVPALVTAALRGVALGAQQWWLVTGERTLAAAVQLAAIFSLFELASLTPTTATLIISASTFVGSVVYLCNPQWWAALTGREQNFQECSDSLQAIASYAWRCWVGAMAGVLLLRLDQVVMVPLAGVEELGIYVVAANISAVALLFNSAVSQVTFAIESGDPSPTRVGLAARMTAIATGLVGIVLISTASWFVPRVFGREFGPAVPVAVILVVEICVAIPGSIAGVALNARGHPGLRSLSLGIAALVYLVAMVLLVPRLGAIGAAIAMAAGTVLPGLLNIYFLRRYCGFPLVEFCRIRGTDWAFMRRLVRGIGRG